MLSDDRVLAIKFHEVTADYTHTLSTQTTAFQRLVTVYGGEWGRRNQVWKLWVETFSLGQPSHIPDAEASSMSKHKGNKVFKWKIASTFFLFFFLRFLFLHSLK